DGVRAMKAGAVDFLQKPADNGRLLAAVTAALNASRREAEARRERTELARRMACLTPRELDVFRLVASGLRNREVSERLHIAEKTVKIHRARVMLKLGAATVADLVLLSQQLARPVLP
ncbi:MAG: response regulator transcription factor, partial [Deferrisomatales bacterium]